MDDFKQFVHHFGLERTKIISDIIHKSTSDDIYNTKIMVDGMLKDFKLAQTVENIKALSIGAAIAISLTKIGETMGTQYDAEKFYAKLMLYLTAREAKLEELKKNLPV